MTERRSKYNAVPTVADGHRFASKREEQRYQELKLLQFNGDISALELHPRFELQPAFRYGGKAYGSIKYTADFSYIEEPGLNFVVEEVKGKEDTAFRIRLRLFLYRYPGTDFRIVR